MRRHAWAVVGAGLMVLGIALYLTSPTHFGWFAYTPLDDQVRFSGDVVVWSRGRVVGCLIAGLGLVVLSWHLGYRAGQRRGAAV